MILYIDTSALVKRYLNEDGTEAVMSLCLEAEALAISEVGYAETLAAFYRKSREGVIDAKALRKAIQEFKSEWETMATVSVGGPVNQRVEALIATHGLRGFDAIHLASAVVLKDQGIKDLVFLAADQRLVGAAKAERLQVA
jgi:uncharacterized protein